MEFDLQTAPPILARTPTVLNALVRNLPPAFALSNEGADTWNPFDVVGHLVHGERTDWIPRIEHLLAHGEAVPFASFDRFAQFEASKGKSLGDLLDTFASLRAASLVRLEALHLSPADLERTGRHPELGIVTLRQLLATWIAHDFDHIVQVARCVGSQYSEAVGPWREYLRIARPS